MKTLLIAINSKYIHTALAVDYLYEVTKDLNTEKMEFNINQNYSHVFYEIAQKKPEVILFSTYIWNIDYIRKLSRDLKKATGAMIGWGGIEASFDVDEHFKNNPALDLIIRGEGEVSTRELLFALENNADLRNVSGVSFRNDDKIIHNKNRELIKNLDDIPSPFDNFKYTKGKIVYYEMARGCPFKCTFCMSSTIKGVRYFGEKRIKSDILKIINSGAKIVKLVDRTFNANEKKSMEFMDFIRENARPGMIFHMELMAHLISDEFLDYLRTLPKGLFQFEIGVQSTNTKTLEAIERVTDFDRLKNVVEKIHSYNNIHQHVDQIAGLPYEDYESFRKSFDDIYSLPAEKHQLGFLKVLRGSKMKLDAEKYGLVYSENPPYEVLRTDFISTDELYRLKIIEDLVEEFRNENHFDNTLSYLLKDISPFVFYEELSKFWEKNGYHKVGHKLEDLYKKLYEFLLRRSDIAIIIELIRLDFISNIDKNPPEYLNPRPVLNEEKHEILKDKRVRALFEIGMETPTKFLVKDFRFEKIKIGGVIKMVGVNYKKDGNVVKFIY
ncbi:MAG: B12-binding domain-containing radical SAM protein [Ezakiella sp.]|nr:B12-binding domain-containing radical SAM protein [Ezakiella sp.]MDD7471683.1 DUF4080 domain-containing protein [Bacillota bacterium]MDY3922861.1 DUF4080 domain-containing protein [Ezakiella sp.]